MPTNIPTARIREGNAGELNSAGDYVLYWMIANRRTRWNYSLDRAIGWAQHLKKPLVVLEALRCDYKWNSDRFHAFVIAGMADNEARFAKSPVTYYPYLESRAGEGSGLLATLAKRACVVVSDDFPSFFLPAMLRAAGRQIPVKFELVDSNGLWPMRLAEKDFARAFDFRRFLQKSLPSWLSEFPQADPLKGLELPTATLPDLKRWPSAKSQAVRDDWSKLKEFPIDHAVTVAAEQGGEVAARAQLKLFLDQRLPIYGEQRNQPEVQAASELSAYLHFGHLSVHEIFADVIEREKWTPDKLSSKVTGSSSGWWGLSATAESFLDELITWRELGYNMCSQRSDYDRYESLPDWAQATLAEHADDPREHVYTLDEFEFSRTQDPLWNAAQAQLVHEGRIHNYLRMLWGKKVLEWSPSPREALETMVHLNNKYALDGRNPNSYSGIFWVLGRYDRPWGPERPIYGKIRYMTSENTARKVSVKNYVAKYTGHSTSGRLFAK
jgi:deoxyribodipyrimidine photo-lyase